MELSFVVLCWALAAGAIWWWATEWGRSGIGYFLLSIFLSPILAAIVLAIAGNKAEHEAKERRRTEEQRREHERQLESLRAVAGTSSAVPTRSVADELEKLGALRERGLLTDDELSEQKRRLLAR